MIDNISEKEWLGKSVDECKYIIQYLHTADKISRKKLQKIYFVITHIEKTPTGFTQLCKRYGIKVGKMRFDKKCEQGIRVK